MVIERAPKIARTEVFLGIVEAVTSFAKNVKEKDEALPAEVVKVIVAALCLYKRRFKDVFMREYVEVCVCMCGWWRGGGSGKKVERRVLYRENGALSHSNS